MTHVYSEGEHERDVERLWGLAAGLPVVEVDPEAFHEWDECGWEASTLALKDIVEYLRGVLDADLAYPVIVSAEGNVMDGYHRIAKAALDGRLVPMVQFEVTPPPDRLVG